MNNDRPITITTAGSRKSVNWQPSTMMWSEFVAKLATPIHGTETLAEYMGYTKGKQDELKDVGGYVAGTLAGSRRKAGAVIGRDVITLDMDNIPAGGKDDVLRRIAGLGCAYAVYSTRKHCDAAPRLRVLVVLSRTVSADEYEPIARKLAEIIGITLCDPSTFEASRLMYWPSCSADSIYVYSYADKPFLDADGVLAMYADWHDVMSWPTVPGAGALTQKLVDKQQDPTTKDGVVGAFCKVYNIYRVIEELIPGVYVPCDGADDRYTYAEGSTAGGAVIYDDGKFLYSHHATDPAGGKLCNAFDLVRLHKFGKLDDEAKEGTPIGRMPSYVEMRRFAAQNREVTTLLGRERYDAMTADFGSPEEPPVDFDPNWVNKLAISPNTGRPEKTIDNALIVLENDPMLKSKIAFDEFSNRGLVLGQLPWDTRNKRRDWSDADDAGLRHYMEKVYEITGKDRLIDATTLCAKKHTINDVQDYLKPLVWDGVERLDTLLIDYLGAADEPYTRKVTRKAFTAAVARALVPGIKYDWVLILAGPQGIGKSTLLRVMGRHWYSDSLTSFDGKEASEMIQGTWINELGELSSLNKSETNTVKQFLSRMEDIYREPFGRRTGRYPRRCVFFGTSNEGEFLRDATGSRRFWPVTLMVDEPKKSVFDDLESEVDQIWAEAKISFENGEKLHLNVDEEQLAKEQQEKYKETNAKEGIILGFIEKKVPEDWQKRTLIQRMAFWSGDFGHTNETELVERDRVCAAEIWCECFGRRIGDMRRSDTAEINSIMLRAKGWKRDETPNRYGPYNMQRGYRK